MSPSSIICISVNPALDRRVRLPKLAVGSVNRATHAEAVPGGKAAHVAMGLTSLGARALWLGFLGGAVGGYCAEQLRKAVTEVIAVRTTATRVNVELIEACGTVTEILDPGVPPGEVAQQELIRTLEAALNSEWNGALTVISGSLPTGVAPEYYATMINIAHHCGSKVLFDSSGSALEAGLSARPEFVKINRHEAEAVFGEPIHDRASALRAASRLINQGAASAALTLGAEGLVWLESERGPAWIANVPPMRCPSPVGCGDATLAGFAYAFSQKMSGVEAIRLAAACGAANCLAEIPGKILFENVEALTPGIQVEQPDSNA